MRLAAMILALAAPAAADTIQSAEFTEPTTRYAHGVLGDAIEWGNLQIVSGASVGDEGSLFSANRSFTWNITLPENRVFEDLDPRLWDVTGDGSPEVVVVMTQADLGAALIVIGLVDGKPEQIASTPFIGRTNRWLAPVGAVDIDGDGHIEIAYVDRPHLAKTLRIWRYDDGDFREVWSIAGLTNHRIGQDFIQGGVRACEGTPSFVLASGDWQQIVSVSATGDTVQGQAVAPYGGPESLTAALNCN